MLRKLKKRKQAKLLFVQKKKEKKGEKRNFLLEYGKAGKIEFQGVAKVW